MKQTEEAIFYLAVILFGNIYVDGLKAVHDNLAYKKKLSLRGQVHRPHEPGKAVDGLLGTTNLNVECSLVSVYNGLSHMQVDLGQKYRLGLIRILNNKEEPYRLHSLNITVFNDGDDSVCAEYPDPAPEGWLELQCAHVIVGNYVRVTKAAHDSKDLLNICELEVYESRAFEFVKQHGYQCASYDVDVRSRSELHCGMICRETSNCMSFNVGISENSVHCQIITKNTCQPKRKAENDVIWSYFTTTQSLI